MSSISWGSVCEPARSAHSESLTVLVSWSSSARRRTSRSSSPNRSTSPVAIARPSASLIPTSGPNAATCTPHSYRAPFSAVVRRIISSRSRGSTVVLPRIPAPSGRMRLISSGWTASVRNSVSGSTSSPGGIHLRSICSVSGSYGGSTGGMRAFISEAKYRFYNRSASDASPLTSTRSAGTRLGDRPARDGAARSARTPLDPAGAVGAADAGRLVPRPPGPLRRHVVVGPERAPGRAARRGRRDGGRRLGLLAHRGGPEAAGRPGAARRLGPPLGASRRLKRAIPLLAAVVALGAAAPAQATFTSTISGGAPSIVGNSDSDILTIRTEGSLLAHDHGTDPGFSGNTDWNSSAVGPQTVSTSSVVVVSVDAGPGEDVVVIGSNGGTSAAALIPDFAIDGGAGLDGLIIDSSADFLVGRTATVSSGAATGNVAFGSGTSFHHTDVEGVIGRMGSGADTVNVSNTEGYTALAAEGGGGNDTLNVAPSTLFGSFEFDGGSGTNDTVNAGDGGAAGGTYLVGSQSIGRSGFSLLKLNSSTERLTLTTGSGADQIYKTGARPATLNAGGGDDLISARDSVGDTANCGAGSDFVLSDSLDTLNDCEASDRTLAQPPPTTPTDPG